MNLARRFDRARAIVLHLRVEQFDTVLFYALRAKVWTELMSVIILIAGISVHYSFPPIPMELISVFLATVVVNAALLVFAAGISWKRDKMLTEAIELANKKD